MCVVFLITWSKLFLVVVCVWTLLASSNAAAVKEADDSFFSSEEQVQLLTDIISLHVDKELALEDDYKRILATASEHQCGQILKNYEAEMIQRVLSESLATGKGPDLTEQQSTMIGGLLLPMFRYGIQIRKICGRASDYPDVVSTLCVNGDGDVGCDSMQSGILMLPIEDDAIKTGTLAGTFAFHGYLANSHTVPSNVNFKEGSERGAMGTTAMLLSSLIGTAVIMPDYLGGGEEAGETFRPFLKRETYPISAMALLSAAEDAVKKESNCASAIDDAFYMLGHFEGGYATAAVADAFVNQLGKTIYWASTSHAPFRPGSAQMNFFAQQERDGTLNSQSRYMIYRLGATYSHSNPVDLMEVKDATVDQQSLLVSNSSQEVLDTLMSEFVQDDIDSLLASDHPLQSSWNPAFVSAMEQSLDQGLSGPCDPSLVSDETNILCSSLMAQDLTAMLETVDFPMTICHSPESDTMSFDNVPQDEDKLSETIMIATPDTASLAACLQGLLIFAAGTMIQSLDATYIPVNEKTTAAGECLM